MVKCSNNVLLGCRFWGCTRHDRLWCGGELERASSECTRRCPCCSHGFDEWNGPWAAQLTREGMQKERVMATVMASLCVDCRDCRCMQDFEDDWGWGMRYPEYRSTARAHGISHFPKPLNSHQPPSTLFYLHPTIKWKKMGLSATAKDGRHILHVFVQSHWHGTCDQGKAWRGHFKDSQNG